MASDLPEVLTVSVSYAGKNMAELGAFVRQGGHVRVVDFVRGQDLWLGPDAPQGIVPDLTLHRARRERAMRSVRSRRKMREAAG
jgi:hypothetical protein